MWINNKVWEMEECGCFSVFQESEPGDIPVIVMTPAELEARERRVWEAARETATTGQRDNNGDEWHEQIHETFEQWKAKQGEL